MNNKFLGILKAETVREIGFYLKLLCFFGGIISFILITLFMRDLGDTLRHEHYKTEKFTPKNNDWQEYENYLDQGDRILITGRGDIILKFGDNERKIKLIRLKPHTFNVPFDGKVSIKFISHLDDGFCNLEIHSASEVKAKRFVKIGYILIFLVPIIFWFVLIPLCKKIERYKTKDEEKNRIRKRVGLK